jgi:hypothetical protein
MVQWKRTWAKAEKAQGQMTRWFRGLCCTETLQTVVGEGSFFDVLCEVLVQ